MDGADMYDYPIENASDYALYDMLAAGEEMTFIYDFGDTWRHTVKVLECVDYGKEEEQHIRLLDGKNACPPNDVGGIGGYKEMLKIIKDDPDSEEAWEYYTWLGSKWNEKFFPAIDTAIALNELNHMQSADDLVDFYDDILGDAGRTFFCADIGQTPERNCAKMVGVAQKTKVNYHKKQK